jgi:hypothetical protein
MGGWRRSTAAAAAEGAAAGGARSSSSSGAACGRARRYGSGGSSERGRGGAANTPPGGGGGGGGAGLHHRARRERGGAQQQAAGAIATPFDLAKQLRAAVQARDLAALERLLQHDEAAEMDDRRCVRVCRCVLRAPARVVCVPVHVCVTSAAVRRTVADALLTTVLPCAHTHRHTHRHTNTAWRLWCAQPWSSTTPRPWRCCLSSPQCWRWARARSRACCRPPSASKTWRRCCGSAGWRQRTTSTAHISHTCWVRPRASGTPA